MTMKAPSAKCRRRYENHTRLYFLRYIHYFFMLNLCIAVEGQRKMIKKTGEIYICTTLMRTIKPCLPS